jgi:hypothetical protein
MWCRGCRFLAVVAEFHLRSSIIEFFRWKQLAGPSGPQGREVWFSRLRIELHYLKQFLI